MAGGPRVGVRGFGEVGVDSFKLHPGATMAGDPGVGARGFGEVEESFVEVDINPFRLHVGVTMAGAPGVGSAEVDPSVYKPPSAAAREVATGFAGVPGVLAAVTSMCEKRHPPPYWQRPCANRMHVATDCCTRCCCRCCCCCCWCCCCCC